MVAFQFGVGCNNGRKQLSIPFHTCLGLGLWSGSGSELGLELERGAYICISLMFQWQRFSWVWNVTKAENSPLSACRTGGGHKIRVRCCG
jgi:hypothetical protein